MAKATLVRPKPVRQPTGKVVLELTEGEADFILAVTAFIAGDYERSPRKYSDRIRRALETALGIGYTQTDAYKLRDRLNLFYGGIWFRDYNDANV
jgi:hypothetical protein